ncbi:peptide chain release factor N(5)-glutamine methyltransferase [Methylovulum psychrotolerans]|uniref:Release factor glutamine methyltransferase n=2 Tax=Methylovulum psychrotolerans TaxID=1704499 RepID=A0A2S5CSA6_9GAMM|nr:peptide chain release factor N(5)-glutamine methyltransferase [Methylovulum psychrotolerans]
MLKYGTTPIHVGLNAPTQHQIPMPTINALLAQASQNLNASSGSPALDAEVLLCHVLQKNRSYLRARCDNTLTETEQEQFWQLCRHRQQGHPIAYLTGQREFWSRDFIVTPDVLIPRPDTELLIELSLALVAHDAPGPILDLGTGSGIIAIILAAERPNAHVTATDFSPKALAVAQQNAARHHLNNIGFYHSNWFADLPPQRFQLIVSNPPYIDPQDPHLHQGDVRFEPDSALIAADHGLQDIKTIVATARHWLSEEGYLLIEHGYDQEAAVQAIFKASGYQDVRTHKDLSGQARVTGGQT